MLNTLNQEIIFSSVNIFDFYTNPLAFRLADNELALLERSQYANSDFFEKVQTRKLARILRSASNIPYWQERYDMSSLLLEGATPSKMLADFPLLTRQDLRSHGPAKFINSRLPQKRLYRAYTSGSTGEPLTLLLDASVIPGRIARFKRMARWFNVGDVTFVRCMPRTPLGFAGFASFPPYKKDLDENFLKDLYSYIAGMRRPVIVDMFPSHIERLAHLTTALNIEPPPIIGFVSGGEQALQHTRDVVREVFSCDMRSYYGATEFEVIGQDCGVDEQRSYHINAEYFYVEVVDDGGRRVPDGTMGRVLITSLEHEVFPFIRYEIGDMGHFVASPCPCGRTLPRLIIEGRAAHLIPLPNGRVLSYFDFRRPIVMMRGVRQFQISHDAPDRFTVKITPVPAGITAENVSNLHEQYASYLGADIVVTLEIVNEIESAKNGKRVEFIRRWD